LYTFFLYKYCYALHTTHIYQVYYRQPDVYDSVWKWTLKWKHLVKKNIIFQKFCFFLCLIFLIFFFFYFGKTLSLLLKRWFNKFLDCLAISWGGTTLCTRHTYIKYIIDNRMFTIQFENGLWSENISLKKIFKLSVNLSSCLIMYTNI
jgi:hypothetical protein